MDIIVE